jgi:hypothetical protein
LFVCLHFWDRVSHYAAQAYLELMILLPQLPKCWNYRCVPSCSIQKASLLLTLLRTHISKRGKAPLLFWVKATQSEYSSYH